MNTLARFVGLVATAPPATEGDFPPSSEPWSGDDRTVAGLRQPLN